MTTRRTTHLSLPLTLWLAVVGALVAAWGLFGPWVPHKAAGLVIPGLDLAEYVKFLPAVTSGQVAILREIFYAPLGAASLALSLLAFRVAAPRGLAGAALRLMLVLLAVVIALNLLPPAWTPTLLYAPEFRLQSGVMALLVALALLSPLLALLPCRLAGAVLALTALAAALAPLPALARVWPLIEEVYATPLRFGWGLWATLAGLALCAAAALRWAIACRG